MKLRVDHAVLVLSLLPFCLGANCSDRIESLGSPFPSHSRISVDFWNKMNRPPPLSFHEMLRDFRPKFENGIPTFDSRPQSIGITEWVTAFARAHPLEASLIAEAEAQLRESRRTFQRLRAMRDFKNSEICQSRTLIWAFRSQYYAEMSSALRGEFLPFPAQGEEVLADFLVRRNGGGLFDLIEAHTRLYEAEGNRMKLGSDALDAVVCELSRSIDFYEMIISRLPTLDELSNPHSD